MSILAERVGARSEATHFFMMMYLRALPRVWPSSRNSKEAAVGVEPGSCNNAMLDFPLFHLSLRICRSYQE